VRTRVNTHVATTWRGIAAASRAKVAGRRQSSGEHRARSRQGERAGPGRLGCMQGRVREVLGTQGMARARGATRRGNGEAGQGGAEQGSSKGASARPVWRTHARRHLASRAMAWPCRADSVRRHGRKMTAAKPTRAEQSMAGRCGGGLDGEAKRRCGARSRPAKVQERAHARTPGNPGPQRGRAVLAKRRRPGSMARRDGVVKASAV
jgi:hypothetical protein